MKNKLVKQPRNSKKQYKTTTREKSYSNINTIFKSKLLCLHTI